MSRPGGGGASMSASRITDRVPVVRARPDGERVLESMYWTLLPPGADGRGWRLSTWNLRSEGLEESRMYAQPFKARPVCCLRQVSMRGPRWMTARRGTVSDPTAAACSSWPACGIPGSRGAG